MNGWLKNHWTWIVGGLVVGGIAWGTLTADVKNHERRITSLEVTVDQKFNMILDRLPPKR